MTATERATQTTTETGSGRRPLAMAMVAAPVLWLAAEAVSPALKSDSAAQLAVITQHPDRWFGYTALLTLGMILFVPAILGVMRLTRARMPRLTLLGGALLGYGTIIAVGDAMSQLTSWQMVTGHADRAQMAALLDRTSNASGASLFFAPGGLAFLVGAIMLTVALVRTRVVPVWVSITFLLGIVVQLVGFTSSSVAAIAASAVICLVAMAMLARRLWTGAPSEHTVAATAERGFVPAI
jgi:hypothetical protein